MMRIIRLGMSLGVVLWGALDASSAHAAVVVESSALTATANDCVDASVSVSPPSGLASGDVWVITFAADTNRAGAESLQDISGFTGVVASQLPVSGGTWPVMRMWYKIAGASESAVNVTSAAGCFWGSNAGSIRLSGANSGGPLAASRLTNANVAATSTPIGSMAVPQDGSIAILFFSYASTTAPTLPSGTTALGGGSGTLTNPGAGFAYQAVNSGTYDPSPWTHGSIAPRISIAAVFSPAGMALSGCVLWQNGTDKVLWQNGTDGMIFQGGGDCALGGGAAVVPVRMLMGVGL